MLRLLPALLIFFSFSLYACQGGYFACVDKVKDSKTFQNNFLWIPVGKKQRLLYSPKPPHNVKIIKEDPFLSLYLIQSKQTFAYPFDVNMRLQLGTAAVNDTHFQEGKILQPQVGLNRLGIYSSKFPSPALVTSSCCSLEGILTKNGLIDKYYLHHFLTSKMPLYADFGIRVKDVEGCVRIEALNPYLPTQQMKQGDCVLAYDGKKVRNAAVLMRFILFSKIGSKHRLQLKRGKKIYSCTLRSVRRLGGGAISDTFLEYQGLYFSKDLHVKRVEKKFAHYGIENGDKLLMVNGVQVSNQEDVRNYIQTNKKISQLLLERNNFQFFVNIK